MATYLLTDGESPVAYGEMLENGPLNNTLGTWIRVHPDYASQEIYRTMIMWAESQLEILSRWLALESVTHRLRFLDSESAACALAEEMGYQLARQAYRMDLILNQRPHWPMLPSGFSIRPMSSAELPTTLAVFREAFDGQWGHDPRPFEAHLTDWKAWYNGAETDPALWLVLVDEADEIAGLSLSRVREGVTGPLGWVSELGLRPAWRGRGLGEALLRASFTALFGRSARKIGLHVDSANPTAALDLYRRVGMRQDYALRVYEKSFS
jgi:ribosomal protein S18 acetylase RimI-like enzyme